MKVKLIFLMGLIMLFTSCSSLLTQQKQIGYITNSNKPIDEKTVDLKELLNIKGTM